MVCVMSPSLSLSVTQAPDDSWVWYTNITTVLSPLCLLFPSDQSSTVTLATFSFVTGTPQKLISEIVTMNIFLKKFAGN